ncbi:MAG: LysM peptidoglycan-binding domain-containing protein [Chloroflexota bacterium]
MTKQFTKSIWLISVLATLACARTGPDVIVITATFEPAGAVDVSPSLTAPVATPIAFVPPTLNPPRIQSDASSLQQYTVQAGDTLGVIANTNSTSVEALLAINDIPNPDILSVGQVINLPAQPTDETPPVKIIPDGRFVRGESGSEFDVEAFVREQPGYINTAADLVRQRQANGTEIRVPLTGAQIIDRVATEFSVDPRLLLALLEYRSGWLTNPSPAEDMIRYPMGEVDEAREGLYRQLTWTADRLNRGYYGWRYRNLKIIQVDDGTRLFYHPQLNAGTVAVQYFLSLNNTLPVWEEQVSEGGFDAFYRTLFGDPFSGEIATPVPMDIAQPELTLPFASGEVWFYTGGPHGGWGSGSAWAAVDFAPPDERTAGQPACYTSTFPIRAVAAGNIVRSGNGAVVLDMDGDSNEATGWSILYLHIATAGRIEAGQTVATGDVIGYASCEGGFSTATHMHIGRRYNGEWIPAYCNDCETETEVPVFRMSGWAVIGFDDQEYQGIIVQGNERRQAEQGRQNPINRVSW